MSPQSYQALRSGVFLRILDCAMARRFPVLALECGRGPSNERGRGRDKSADRLKSRDRGEVMCFACDSTDHRAGDLK